MYDRRLQDTRYKHRYRIQDTDYRLQRLYETKLALLVFEVNMFLRWRRSPEAQLLLGS